ncbi:MAG: metallophosphoesterase family protein [Deltaproteobacteria bacterium]|nr:metallophosphoesterase family protein [Deltaproteobacteria bacterium]
MIKSISKFLVITIVAVSALVSFAAVKQTPDTGGPKNTPVVKSATPCTAILSSDFNLQVPYLLVGDQAYWAKFQVSTKADGAVLFQVTGHGPAAGQWGSCLPAIYNTRTFLYNPDIMFNNVSYWAVSYLEPIAEDFRTSDQQMVFKLFSVAPNSIPTGIMLKGPYLIYPGKNSGMTVLWQTNATPTSATIEWGSTPSYGAGPISVPESGSGDNEHQFAFNLANLTPGTFYYYRVTVNGTPFTGTFKTAPPDNADSLTFYVYGDTRAFPGTKDSVNARMMSDINADQTARQTFLLHTADYVLYGLDENMWNSDMFNRTYPNTMNSMANLPFMGALGNHESYDVNFNYDWQNIGKLFKKYFPYRLYPDPAHYYYSFDYGPVHVAVIDTWSYHSEVPDSAQLTWLNNDLANSTRPWKIIALHTPIYDCKEGDASIPNLRKALDLIIARNNVKLILQGHVHYYARVNVNGVNYVTIGGGGAELTPVPATCAPDMAPYVVTVKSVHHLGRVEIKGDTLTLTAMATDGTIIDTLVINK